MSEDKISEQLARLDERMRGMEEQLNRMASGHDEFRQQLYMAIKDLAKATASTASAHKRLDEVQPKIDSVKSSVYWTLGFSVTLVGIFASVLTTILVVAFQK